MYSQHSRKPNQVKLTCLPIASPKLLLSLANIEGCLLLDDTFLKRKKKMAPAVTSTNAADRDRKQRPGEKKSDLVCRVKYSNTLPDIPFEPKFITYPFSSNRFVDYKPTSLERNYKYDLLTEHDLATLHPEDERLLEEDTLTPQDSKRSRHHNKAVPWLKKTEYISNEFNRYGHSSEKTETKVGYNVKKMFKEENLYMNRESQISAINKTFADAKIPIQNHYSKPNVHAVEELPLFPDFELWRYPFAQVIFDAEPVAGNRVEEMSQAMIRGVVDDSGEQFVAYFLPTEETLGKRKRDAENGMEYDDEDTYEYKMAREYNWNVKNKASKGYEENYFFVTRDGNVYYNELETRVRLNKRRLKPGAQANSNSKLVVRHRPLDEVEHKTQMIRMTNLDPPPEEEEEEEAQSQQLPEEEKENKEDEEEEEEKVLPHKVFF
ncbi:RNA polymerase II-associated factor 1 homolog [Caerostris extrusa]|uniref:RNA polymerase II-associated factor 1 homolog n=1 Tax=Caerostris extrusa TaxID=172846 RepID=A0AAV4VII1_CAEEX|nr:RNA polymerase II-associated factor 1 homolog [Caerostris extrusa]